MDKLFRRLMAVALVLALVCVITPLGMVFTSAATATDLSNCMDLSYGALAAALDLEKVHWNNGTIYPVYYSDYTNTEIATSNKGAAEVKWSDPAFSFYGIKPGNAFNISTLNSILEPQGFHGVVVCDYEGPGSGDYVANRDYNATVSFIVSGGVITQMGLYYRSVNEEFGQNAALTFDVKGGRSIAKYVTMADSIFGYATVALPSTTRDGYTFLGWSAASAATTADWQAGSDYTITESKNLFAVWESSTEPSTQKWWDDLPGFLRWILRYIFFGWAWM